MGKIPFGPEDYTESELSKVRGLLEKAERCAPDTISKKKRELWGNFLVGTISSVGSSTGAAGVSDVVGMAQSLGATSGAGGISTVLSVPSSSSIRINWLYFAMRSVRDIEPVFICPAFVATAKSAIVVSSVSPLR